MTTATATTATTTKQSRNRNGIDVDGLMEVVEAIKADPKLAETTWKVTSRWQGGTRSDHHVDGLVIGGEHVDRQFRLQVDEPHELKGTHQCANPQEYLLAATSACMMVGYAAVAALMGITLSKLEVEISGDIDLRGFLAIDRKVAPGYLGLKQTVRLGGDGTPQQFEQLHKIVKNTSPNYFNLTNSVPIESELIVE